MRFFTRRTSNEAPAKLGPVRSIRIPPHACTACGQVRGLYAYANNDRNYCIACARDVWEVAGLQPAGHRNDDVTLDELIQYEVGGQRAG